LSFHGTHSKGSALCKSTPRETKSKALAFQLKVFFGEFFFQRGYSKKSHQAKRTETENLEKQIRDPATRSPHPILEMGFCSPGAPGGIARRITH
jgi:hypothetical protein